MRGKQKKREEDDFVKNLSGTWKEAVLKKSVRTFNTSDKTEVKEKIIARFFSAEIVKEIRIGGEICAPQDRQRETGRFTEGSVIGKKRPK